MMIAASPRVDCVPPRKLHLNTPQSLQAPINSVRGNTCIHHQEALVCVHHYKQENLQMYCSYYKEAFFDTTPVIQHYKHA